MEVISALILKTIIIVPTALFAGHCIESTKAYKKANDKARGWLQHREEIALARKEEAMTKQQKRFGKYGMRLRK